jgi:hypothetical protein
MKRTNYFLLVCSALLVALLLILPSCFYAPPYMKMNPPADSDKLLPVPPGDYSCWMHSATNMLAGAGYGNGTTVQARADDIWADMNAQYGTGNGGWIDTALQWWLGSSNNIWPANPYTVVTVIGNKPKIPWADANGAQRIANELRSCNMVGVSISWPTGQGGTGGHAITGWGDDSTSVTALTTNPGGVRVADSDTDNGGDVQAYTYDTYTNPNPGGPNEGNGWYFNYGTPHPFIKHICILSPTSGPSGPNMVRVTGSYQIHQTNNEQASDLHYRVGTDVDILTYRTWLDWEGTPEITESQPRRELTVDWNLSQNKVPQCTWVTINTEFVEPSWNSISYQDVHFTYPKGKDVKFPELAWIMTTPVIDRAEAIPNVTGGYVIGSFDIFDPKNSSEPAVRYRFVHQYLYNQSPESHTFVLSGTPGFTVANLLFGHSYGYPTAEELWKFKRWMTKADETYTTSEKGVEISIDWKGQLPYPEGDRGTDGRSSNLK